MTSEVLPKIRQTGSYSMLTGTQMETQALVKRCVAIIGSQRKLADHTGINLATISHAIQGKFKGKISADKQREVNEACKRIISYDPEAERKAKRLAAEKEEVLYQLMILLAKENLSEEGKETIMQTYSFIKQSI